MLTKGFSKEAGDREKVRDFVVLFTDGKDTSDLTAVHAKIRAERVKVLVIGVSRGDPTTAARLQQISGDPDNVHVVPTYNDLSTLVTWICEQVNKSMSTDPFASRPSIHFSICAAALHFLMSPLGAYMSA